MLSPLCIILYLYCCLTALEAYGLAVPEIMPLETLHNSLTLARFDKFLTNIIDMGAASPKRSYTAMPLSLIGSLGLLLFWLIKAWLPGVFTELYSFAFFSLLKPVTVFRFFLLKEALVE